MHHNHPQRSPEWYAARKDRVTGSVAGAILGLDPNKSAKQVMKKMLEGYSPKSNMVLEYGKTLEPMAVGAYELETGNDVTPCGFFTYQDWLGASPDGLINEDGIVEIKCPWKNREGGTFDPCAGHYYAQVQVELLCSERRWCHFWQWSATQYRLETIDYSQAWLDKNLPVLKAFYYKYLEAKC